MKKGIEQPDLRKSNSYESVVKALHKLSSKERAKTSAWFFKTGKGEYGEGDLFIGIIVPEQRKVAKAFKDLAFSEIQKILKSKIHEHRFVALEILVMQYEKGNDKQKEKVVDFYLKNTKYINNWDLVDTSAPYILGDYLLSRDKNVLYTFATSENIWERRIAIVSTSGFISQNHFEDTLKIAKILLHDKQDLIQKAVGWMLREVGKKSLEVELKFLDRYYKIMPRTMLRYAIERLSPEKRKFYLNKNRIL